VNGVETQRLTRLEAALRDLTTRLDGFHPTAEGFVVGSTRLFEKLVIGEYHLHQRGSDGTESDLTGARSLQGVAISETPPTAGYVLVYNASTGEIEWTASSTPGAHVLATTAGLGPSQTVSGLTAGQVLRATGAAAAAFAVIQDGDLPATITRDTELVKGLKVATKVVAAVDASADCKGFTDYTCDGTDDETQLNLAVAALTALGGGILQVVGKTITCSATGFSLDSNIHLKGDGLGGTTFKKSDKTNADLIMAIGKHHVKISGITADGIRAGTNGGDIANNCIRLETCYASVIKNVEVIGGYSRGLNIETCHHIAFSNVLLTDCWRNFMIHETAGTTKRHIVGNNIISQDAVENGIDLGTIHGIVLSNFSIDGCGAGLALDSCSHVQLNNGLIVGGKPLSINSGYAAVTDIDVFNVHCDASVGYYNFTIEATAFDISRVNLAGVRSTASPQGGIYLLVNGAGNIADVTIDNPTIDTCAWDGIALYRSSGAGTILRTAIDGGSIRNCTQYGIKEYGTYADYTKVAGALQMGANTSGDVLLAGTHSTDERMSTHEALPGVHHAAVTITTDLGDNLLSLVGQELDLSTQMANFIFAGPASGADDAPTFRQLVAADTPNTIPKTVLHANTILKADADHTPIELSVAEQRLIGRITSGVITDLTPAQIMALLSGGAAAAFAMNSQKITGLAAATAAGDAVRYEQLPAGGTIGPQGIPGWDGEDGEDGFPIPGPVGKQGFTGGIGPPGEAGEDGETVVLAPSLKPPRHIVLRALDAATSHTVLASVGGDFEMPIAGAILEIGAYVDTAGVTNLATIDVHKNGTTIMTTNKITIDTAEKTSRTAATAPVLTTTTLAAGDIITIDIDAIQTTAAKGLTVRMTVREA